MSSAGSVEESCLESDGSAKDNSEIAGLAHLVLLQSISIFEMKGAISCFVMNAHLTAQLALGLDLNDFGQASAHPRSVYWLQYSLVHAFDVVSPGRACNEPLTVERYCRGKRCRLCLKVCTPADVDHKPDVL